MLQLFASAEVQWTCAERDKTAAGLIFINQLYSSRNVQYSTHTRRIILNVFHFEQKQIILPKADFFSACCFIISL